jgi:hypothetical protein
LLNIQIHGTLLQESSLFPDFGKIDFVHFPTTPWEQLLPQASDEARQLLAELIVYDSSSRISATKVCAHIWIFTFMAEHCEVGVG